MFLFFLHLDKYVFLDLDLVSFTMSKETFDTLLKQSIDFDDAQSAIVFLNQDMDGLLNQYCVSNFLRNLAITLPNISLSP